jgi:hypothetical protein
MIVHSITPGTYAAARSIRDYVHATVGVSRISDDLVQRAGFAPGHTHVIGNPFDSDVPGSRSVGPGMVRCACSVLAGSRMPPRGSFGFLPSSGAEGSSAHPHHCG